LKKSLLIIFVVLAIDQALKIWVKTTFTMGQELHVAGNWFILHFTENYGMAFGMQFAGGFGKLLLSLFRILAVIGIGYYLFRLIKRKENFGLIACFSLIMAGAIGNIIDSAFYGLIFSDSTWVDVARLFPPGGGYGSFLHGKVVDMFYFPIIRGTWPAWVPVWGGQDLEFFRPVFNIADSAISVGVISLLLFQRWFFKEHAEPSSLTAVGPEETSLTDTSAGQGSDNN
jgi:signal peptidase II